MDQLVTVSESCSDPNLITILKSDMRPRNLNTDRIFENNNR